MRLPGWVIYLVPVVRLLLALLFFAVLFSAWWYTRHRREERLEALVEQARGGVSTPEEAAAARAAILAAPRAPLTATEVAQLARIGELVAAPPLHPLPERMPRLDSPIFVSGFTVADAAGVAVVGDITRHYAVLDIGTGAVTSQGDGAMPEAIAPNGRVIGVWRRNEGTELRDAETGKVLMLLPGVVPYEVRWIGGAGIVHPVPDRALREGRRLVFRAFATGLESSLDVPRDEGHGVVPIPGQPERYAILQDKHWYEMTLTNSAAGWVAKVTGERTWSGRHSRDATNLSADGRLHVSTQGSTLVVADLVQGAERVEDFANFRMQEPVFTADPDRVLLRGFFQLAPGRTKSAAFLYSLSTGLLSEVPVDALPQRILFIRALGINATVDDAVFPVTLPAGEPPGDIATILAMSQQRHEAPRAPDPVALLDALPPEADAVATAAQGARIVGVGVYEGTVGSDDDRGGSVRVRVMRTKQPIVLVLASYEGVRWVVTVDAGADVRAILVSGHTPAQVIGTTVPVHRIGDAYAYREGRDRQELDELVQRWTGKTFDAFDGEYQGDSFMLIE